ncbi:unnamed protein product [Closterium sp. Naga37s-1]|nr:unnamed protein product [Closterium sp. Naga37s-1]
MGGEPTSFNDPPARSSSWKAAQFAERLLITPLDIPDADAPEMKPDMTPGMTLDDQTLSAYDTAPHFLLNGSQPRDVDIESQQSRRQLQAERHDDGYEPTREMIENPAASTKTIKALQVDTSNKTAGISSSATATAGRAAAASGAGDFSPSPAEMLDGASFERLTLVSPRSTADFDFAIAVKNLADSDRENDSFKIKGDFGDSDSAYGDNFPMMVLPRRPRRASYSGSGESFPPKSPPLTTSINSTWRSNGSIAGKAASASSFLNRPPIADTSAGRGWRGALTPRSGALGRRLSVRQSSSDMFEPSGSEAAGPSTSPTEHSASVAPRPSSSAGRIPLLPHRQHHHRRSFSICASDCTTSISSGISGSISGGGGSSGGATPPETDYSAAGYPAAGNTRNPTTPCAAPGGGAVFCPSPRWVGKRSPVAFQRDVWSQQRGCQQGERQHARRHSVSEIDGSVFEELAVAAQRLQE